MASEAFVNGNYAQQNGYGEQNGHFQQQQYSQPSTPSQADIPKDEVGWYFVEQYYTTLSKNPDRLYLYYNKRSQFVSGDETAKVQVCVGQRAINDRIKELDFQDCKVRITNVDSQASDANIVIQVIGEISNRSQPHRKFTQTFVLGTQTNGYFVLNDIFRYIIQEEDEEPQAEEAPAEEEPVPEHTTLTSSEDPVAIEKDASVVDQEIEKLVNGENKAPEPVEEKVSETPERPTEPEPTPLPSPPKPAAAPAKPSGPKTWASMAASAANKSGAVKPAVPAVPAVPAQRSAKPPTAPAAETAAKEESASAGAADSDEWTAVGGSHARQQSRQVAPQQEGPQRRGYIKNVRDTVQSADLKSVLEKFGKVTVDINSQKNCAFVDFDTPEAYQAAVAANPHTVAGESLNVEERKIRPAGFQPRGGQQGGRGGRGDFRGNRGNFNPRGRGTGNARGGRGGAAAPQ